jgi:hypothetical protein
MIVLALNTKPQAIIFIPLWGLLMLSSLQRSRKWKESLSMLAVMLTTQAILLIPFAFGNGGITAVWKPISKAVDVYHWISINAYNMWYYFSPQILPSATLDTEPTAIGLSYFQIGLISFSVALFVVLWPPIKHTILSFRQNDHPPLSRETIWLSAALSVLVFFYFNTRMHERYSYYAFIFLAAYAFYTGRYGLYLLLSITTFLNLEAIVNWFQLKNYETLIFDPKFVATLNAILIIWATASLYRSNTLTRTQPNKAQT